MAKNGFKIIDCDMHIHEPHDLWQRYTDPKFRDRAPVGLNRHFRDIGVEFGGKPVAALADMPFVPGFKALRDAINVKRYSEEMEQGFDSKSQLRAMEKEGLDRAIMFPTRGLLIMLLEGLDGPLAAAIARAYNDWLHDFCRIAPDRMFGSAMTPVHDITLAVAETRRAVTELGFKGIFLPNGHVNGRRWNDPYYEPLWAECQRLGIPVGFHGGGKVDGMLKPYTARFTEFQSLNHPMTMMPVLGDIIAGGVTERFPELKFGFFESNCSWVPWFLNRIHEYAELFGSAECPDLKLEPAEYFKRQCYASVEADEFTAKYLPDFGFEDNIVFSTDYPHTDAKFPNAVDAFMDLPFSDQSRRKYLWDNCAKLYNIT